MSFRSIDQLLRRNSNIKISRNIIDDIHDQKEEQYVQSLRELLLASNQLLEKFDDYHLLLRFLRMRGFNILKAKEIFLSMLKWREDCSVDAIANQPQPIEHAWLSPLAPAKSSSSPAYCFHEVEQPSVPRPPVRLKDVAHKSPVPTLSPASRVELLSIHPDVHHPTWNISDELLSQTSLI
ncbi:hypothetical protein PR202_gb29671 [Eleusine coracana subsp. coracana]|uniref:CRAL/TRIO N-terminal domain-containing protein n=1 Tax=Eleusine coracana subsp. coracana TaxID=191504 RepID=A0AAV5G2B2_ELECO|nr:hypothetical protein PR202_gb29671 [Eleusine coracana subsp. coracana]